MSSARKSRLKKEDIGYGFDSAFPKRLRFLMECANTTQDSLAECLGITRQCVAQWKDGKTKPDIYYLDKIADFFDVSTDYLLGRTEDFRGNADVIAVEKRLGLSPVSQEVFESILQSRTYSDDFSSYTGGFDVINQLLESEFLIDLKTEMNRYIAQMHALKYYEEKYDDIARTPHKERMKLLSESMKISMYAEYQNEITKGEFYLFQIQQSVLKALRNISEQAVKSFNMSKYIETPEGVITAKHAADREKFHKELLEGNLQAGIIKEGENDGKHNPTDE